jgi:hypothetical protein
MTLVELGCSSMIEHLPSMQGREGGRKGDRKGEENVAIN